MLAEVTTDWREEKTPVVMAGIVGSNVGWKLHRTYLFLPVFIVFATINVSWRRCLGLFPDYVSSHDDNHNVMRGEEID
ncbi:2-dehydro-3-deoxygalactonokinase [Shigella flexneri]